MTIAYGIHEPENYGDVFTHAFLATYLEYVPAVIHSLRWLERFAYLPDQKLTNSTLFREIRCFMPRKGKQNEHSNGSGKQFGSSKYGGNELKWINIKLTDEDYATLEQSEATMEYLATCVLGLCVDGYGISLKPVDNGKSFCCTIIGSAVSGSSGSLALASFAGTVRDVLLVTVYKFDDKLGGSFDDADQFLSNGDAQRRFR